MRAAPANLAVDAVLRLRGSGNLNHVQVIKKAGGSLMSSFLEPGFILDKKFGVGQPKRVENARILIANTSMDTDKIKVCAVVGAHAAQWCSHAACCLCCCCCCCCRRSMAPACVWTRWTRYPCSCDSLLPCLRAAHRCRPQVAAIEAAEKDKMRRKVDKIAAHGINVFVNRQLIYNFPEQVRCFCTRARALALRMCSPA